MQGQAFCVTKERPHGSPPRVSLHVNVTRDPRLSRVTHGPFEHGLTEENLNLALPAYQDRLGSWGLGGAIPDLGNSAPTSGNALPDCQWLSSTEAGGPLH